MRMRKKKNADKRRRNLDALFLSMDSLGTLPAGAFYAEAPLRLEIGCGKGDFICGISKREPEFNYLALERVQDIILAAAEKYAASRGLGSLDPHGRWIGADNCLYDGVRYEIPCALRGNVRFLSGDAKNLIPNFPESSVDTVYANFSDPWPKKGYESRRLTNSDRLNEYARILVPSGLFVMKTDNDAFFEYSLESVAAGPFDIVAWTPDVDADPLFSQDNVETEYERSFKSRGVKIKSLKARVKK